MDSSSCEEELCTVGGSAELTTGWPVVLCTVGSAELTPRDGLAPGALASRVAIVYLDVRGGGGCGGPERCTAPAAATSGFREVGGGWRLGD